MRGEVDDSCRRAACGPCTALAQIVGTRPQELSEDVLVVLHCQPRGIVVAVLRTIDDALRIALVVFLVAALGVVIAHHVDRLGIFRLVRHHHACQCTRDGTRCIDVPHHGRQPLGNLSDALGIRLLRLVAAIHRLREVLAVAVENRVRIGVVGIVHLIADGP